MKVQFIIIAANINPIAARFVARPYRQNKLPNLSRAQTYKQPSTPEKICKRVHHEAVADSPSVLSAPISCIMPLKWLPLLLATSAGKSSWSCAKLGWTVARDEPGVSRGVAWPVRGTEADAERAEELFPKAKVTQKQSERLLKAIMARFSHEARTGHKIPLRRKSAL
jgi:hypothetical protein